MPKTQPKAIPTKEAFGTLTKKDIDLLFVFAEHLWDGDHQHLLKQRKVLATALMKALDKLGSQREVSKKRYTISTQEFKSLEAAEAKIREWYEDDELREGTKVFEITGVTYKPELKLVKEVSEHGKQKTKIPFRGQTQGCQRQRCLCLSRPENQKTD